MKISSERTKDGCKNPTDGEWLLSNNRRGARLDRKLGLDASQHRCSRFVRIIGFITREWRGVKVGRDHEHERGTVLVINRKDLLAHCSTHDLKVGVARSYMLTMLDNVLEETVVASV